MFFIHNAYKYRLFEQYYAPLHDPLRFYVYFENNNEVKGIDLVPYGDYIEPNVFGQYIKIIIPLIYHQYELEYVNVIFTLFQLQGYELRHSNRILIGKQINSGEYDMAIMGVRDMPSFCSLLPTNKISQLIWVNDLKYQSSPIYFLTVFSWQLWLLYLIMIIVCIVLGWFTIKITQRFNRSTTNSIHIIYKMTSTLVHQSCDAIFHGLVSCNIFLASFFTLLIIFHASFESLLTSQFAIKTIDLPFNNLDELLQRTEYTICTWGHTQIAENLLLNARAGYKTKAKINVAERCPTRTDNIEDDTNFNFTCAYDKMIFIGDSRFKTWNGCKLTPLRHKYFQQDRAIHVYSGFVFKRQFNVLIIKMKSAGIIDLMTRKFITDDQTSNYVPNEITSNEITSIEFNHISFILIAFVVGVILSGINFAIELGTF